MTEIEKLGKKLIEWYPKQTDIEEWNEREIPEAFYYTCIGGKQIFIRKAYKKYAVCTRGWTPTGYKIALIAGYFEIARDKNIGEAKKLFYKLNKELLAKESEWDRYELKWDTKKLAEEAIK